MSGTLCLIDKLLEGLENHRSEFVFLACAFVQGIEIFEELLKPQSINFGSSSNLFQHFLYRFRDRRTGTSSDSRNVLGYCHI